MIEKRGVISTETPQPGRDEKQAAAEVDQCGEPATKAAADQLQESFPNDLTDAVVAQTQRPNGE